MEEVVILIVLALIFYCIPQYLIPWIKDKKTPNIIHYFLVKYEEIINLYDYGASVGYIPCREILIDDIKNHIKGKEQEFSKSIHKETIERNCYFMLLNRAFVLLSSGRFHFYSASLTPQGESILGIYNACANWLLKTNNLTVAEVEENKANLQDNIKSVG